MLDGTLLAGAGPAFHQSLVNGRLPDIGLGINENRLFSQEEQQQQQHAIQPNEAVLPPLLQDEGAAVGDIWPADEPRRLDTENILEPQENQVVEDANILPEVEASVAINRVTDKAFQEVKIFFHCRSFHNLFNEYHILIFCLSHRNIHLLL